MTTLTVCDSADAAAAHAAHAIHDQIRAGARHLALSGGRTPRVAYAFLAELGAGDAEVWLVDERCVEATHADANARLVSETLGDRVRLHAARGELGPEDAAWLYSRDLVEALGPEPVLDVAVLGLGEDGHTASLFPGRPEADAAHAPVIGVRGSPKPPPERITMTLPVLARAKWTVLLATGEGKREALARLRSGDTELPPARLGGALDEIICDRAAAPAA